jgi:hypothetical protein
MGRFHAICASLFDALAETDRKALRKIATRPALDDDAFCERYYSGSDYPKHIPIRLRRLWARHLGSAWRAVEPSDKPGEVLWWLDYADLYRVTAKEFGIAIPEEDWHAIGFSFDSLVLYLVGRLQPCGIEGANQ